MVALVLLNLDDQFLTAAQDLLDTGAALTLVFGHIITPLPEIRVQFTHLQKTGLSAANIDKSSLQSGLYPQDDPFVYIPFGLFLTGNLYVQFHQTPVVHNCNTSLLRMHNIDQHFLADCSTHCVAAFQMGNPMP